MEYTPAHPRHGLTCESVGGGQILTIGGLDSDSTEPESDVYLTVFDSPDPFTQGLNVFDLGTLWWADQYTASPAPYTPALAIQAVYAAG